MQTIARYASPAEFRALQSSLWTVTAFVAVYIALVTVSAVSLARDKDEPVSQTFYYFFSILLALLWIHLEQHGSPLLSQRTINFYRVIISSVVVSIAFSLVMVYYKPGMIYSYSVSSQVFFATPIGFLILTGIYHIHFAGVHDYQVSRNA